MLFSTAWLKYGQPKEWSVIFPNLPKISDSQVSSFRNRKKKIKQLLISNYHLHLDWTKNFSILILSIHIRHIYMHIFIYLPTSLHEQHATQSQCFKQSLTGLNSEFSFSKTGCYTKVKEHSLPYYAPIAGRRIIRLIPFPMVLLPCEMWIVSSRIWTKVTLSISNDGNHYTTNSSTYILVRICIFYLFLSHTYIYIL